MDTAVFVCVPANPSFEAMWLFDTLNTLIGPNSYFINITDVELSDTVICTANGNSHSANLTVQGKLVSNPKQPSCKKVCGPQECCYENRYKIQSGGQEMAVMVG